MRNDSPILAQLHLLNVGPHVGWEADCLGWLPAQPNVFPERNGGENPERELIYVASHLPFAVFAQLVETQLGLVSFQLVCIGIEIKFNFPRTVPWVVFITQLLLSL